MKGSVRSAALVLLLAAGCGPSVGEGGAPGGGDRAVAAAPDAATLTRLEAEARALADPSGCGEGGACATAPVGSRPCGGPREYVVYCPATTDSAALFRALETLARAEEAYNREHELVSTCEFRMPPETVVENGVCRAVAAGVEAAPM
jgi:hypothetical protein